MNTTQLTELILEYKPNQLIMADALYLKAFTKYKIDRKIFNVYLARVTKKGTIERVQRGIYYRVIDTKLGKTRPNLYKETITLYTQDYKGFFGYETILNQLGLRDEMPRKLTIYTNNFKKSKSIDQNITLKRIHQDLNKDNIKYFEILYMLKDINKKSIDYSDLYPKLAEYILKNDLHFETFFDYMDGFNDKVLHHFIPLKKELSHKSA